MRGHYVRIRKDRHTRTWNADICIGKGVRIGYLGSWLTFDQARKAGVRFADAIRVSAARFITKGYR